MSLYVNEYFPFNLKLKMEFTVYVRGKSELCFIKSLYEYISTYYYLVKLCVNI